MKRILLLIVFSVFTILVLLERLSPFYINNAFLHYSVLFAAISTGIILVGDVLFKRDSRKFILLTLALVALVCYGKYYLSWRGVWKTQTTLYVSTEHPNTTIDFQMRADKLAIGYKKRIIKRQRIAPFADWTTDEDTDTLLLDPSKWTRVNREINEMGLKY